MNPISDSLPDWHLQAACRGLPNSMFFPETGDDTRPAKQVCKTCPVRRECGGYAVENRVKYGIWNGRNMASHSKTKRPR